MKKTKIPLIDDLSNEWRDSTAAYDKLNISTRFGDTPFFGGYKEDWMNLNKSHSLFCIVNNTKWNRTTVK